MSWGRCFQNLPGVALGKNLLCEGHHVLCVRILAAAVIFNFTILKNKNRSLS
jgi:hypothetical protein